MMVNMTTVTKGQRRSRTGESAVLESDIHAQTE